MNKSQHPTALSGLPLDAATFERIKSQTTPALISQTEDQVSSLVLDVIGLHDYSQLLYDQGNPALQGLARQTMMNMALFDARLTEINFILEALRSRLCTSATVSPLNSAEQKSH